MGKVSSEWLSGFMDVVREAKSCLKMHTATMDDLDKETQDILHELELSNIKYKQRARLATRLQTIRKERRKAKDEVELLTPVITFFDTDTGKKAASELAQIIGELRKVERYHSNRTYIKKASKSE